MTVSDTGTGGETREKCRNCGGDAGDNHFDRSLCACGSMHHYCNGCGHALDDCSVSASGGSISDERLSDALLASMRRGAEGVVRAENEGGPMLVTSMLGLAEDILALLAELSRLRAVLTQHDAVTNAAGPALAQWLQGRADWNEGRGAMTYEERALKEALAQCGIEIATDETGLMLVARAVLEGETA